jgi:VWFA-related protein
MKQKRVVWTLATTAFTLALAGGIAAQPPESYRFGEVVDVQLVNVEVWVTDGKGNPITGLTAADFQILEDGKPVETTHFTELDGGRQEVALVERVPADPSSQEQSAEPPTEPPAVDPSHLVLYFDQLHLKPAGRQRLIGDLRGFLEDEQVSAERVLILNQDYGLTTEVTFGSSWEEVEAALDRVAKSPPLGARVELDKRLAIQRMQDAWERARDTGGGAGSDPCGSFVRQASGEAESYARESRQRISVTLDHLASAASYLSGVPGVKTLLYVSDSLERAPGKDLVSFINGLCPAQDQAPQFMLADELSRPFRRLTRHANANRVTIYSLQAHGLQASFSGSAAQRSLAQQGTRGLDTAVRFSERDVLSNLAVETGGRAIFNRNDFDVELAKIGREMGSYYSLAYKPPHGGDELEHLIEVRLRDKKLNVRHRRGYRDKNPDVRMTERLEGAVYLGLVNNPMGVRLGAGDVRAEDKGRVTVPLYIMVPAASVAFLPEEESLAAHLSVQVGTRSTKTDKGIFEHSAFRIRRSTGDETEMVSMVMELTLPEGVHLVAVGLRDDATRESSFVTTTLELRATMEEDTG